jgi:3-hydroxyisobutyrate dehydrogenase-like beta-hydroxyacid dehydrogenase
VKVGFIGLGAMGLPMAKRIVGAGHHTFTTFHRRREPADELAALGARVLESPADVARSVDVVITILPADRELKETVFGENGILQGFSRGQVLIDMTTGTALSMQEVEEAVVAAGGEVLDAPVSGGTPAAAQGTLTIMVGGDARLLEKCRPLLESMGQQIVHVGAVGQGKVVKMVNQMMAAAHLLILGEAFALGMRSGAAPETLYQVVKTSSGYSRMMDLRLPGFLLDGSFQPGFRLDLMKKDVNLALDSGRALNVPLLLTSVVGQLFAAASAAGQGDADFSAAARYVADLAGVRLSESRPSKDDERETADGEIT